MKTDFKKQVVDDLINILAGSATSGKLVNIVVSLLRSLQFHNYDKELMDDFIDLFVMLYLKGNSILKKNLIADLETTFFFLKDKETTIFVDKKFSFKIFFYNLN